MSGAPLTGTIRIYAPGLAGLHNEGPEQFTQSCPDGQFVDQDSYLATPEGQRILDSNGHPTKKEGCFDNSSNLALACALFERSQREHFGLDPKGVLGPNRLFHAKWYSEQSGGVCEFTGVTKGEYAGLGALEPPESRDLTVTFTETKVNFVTDSGMGAWIIKHLPGWAIKFVAEHGWARSIVAVAIPMPKEKWFATRAPGSRFEAEVNKDATPLRPFYERVVGGQQKGANFPYDPSLGDLEIRIGCWRTTDTDPVTCGPEPKYVPREPS